MCIVNTEAGIQYPRPAWYASPGHDVGSQRYSCSSIRSCNAALDVAIRNAHAQGMAEDLLSQSRGAMPSADPLGDAAPRHGQVSESVLRVG
jgi:hypothetical protein